jgi:hypothetical protein
VLYVASRAPLIALDDSLPLRSILTAHPGIRRWPSTRCRPAVWGTCVTHLVASSEKRCDGSGARRYGCAPRSVGSNKVGAVPCASTISCWSRRCVSGRLPRPTHRGHRARGRSTGRGLPPQDRRAARRVGLVVRPRPGRPVSWRMAITALDEREGGGPHPGDHRSLKRVLSLRARRRDRATPPGGVAHPRSPSRISIVWREGFRLDAFTLARRSTSTPSRETRNQARCRGRIHSKHLWSVISSHEVGLASRHWARAQWSPQRATAAQVKGGRC